MIGAYKNNLIDSFLYTIPARHHMTVLMVDGQELIMGSENVLGRIAS